MRTTGVLAAVLLLFSAPAGASAFDLFVNPTPATCSPSTIGGKPEFATLQLAENAALPGEAIGVCPGTYHDVVIIPKASSLTAIGHVIIVPIGGGVCFDITGNGVTVRGFEIKACTTAVRIVANDALIQNNKIHNNGTGVEITGMDNVVRNDLIHDNGDGIVVTGISDGTDIKNNTLRHNSSNDILLESSQGVTVNKNQVQYGGVGIRVNQSSDCTVSFNSVSFNGTGIELTNSTRCLMARNVVTRSKTPPDCDWDSLGANVFTKNTCRTENPAGAWD